MHILRQIPIDPVNHLVFAFVSAGDPSNTDSQAGDVSGIDLGVGSIVMVIGGALGGNMYRKDDTAATDWTLILDANP